MAVIPEPAFPGEAIESHPFSPLSSRDFLLWRLCTWSGLVYVLGEFVCWAGIARFVPPPREDWSADRIAEFFREHEVGIRVGMEGVLIFAMFYVLLTLSLARVMER